MAVMFAAMLLLAAAVAMQVTQREISVCASFKGRCYGRLSSAAGWSPDTSPWHQDPELAPEARRPLSIAVIRVSGGTQIFRAALRFSEGNMETRKFSAEKWGGDLFVRGKGLFSKYQGRPRSTREAFDEEGFFRTGHRAEKVEDVILPLPALGDQSLEQEVDRHLTRTPNVQRYPQMRPDWKIKKVPIRVYQYWKANWGGVLVTKKHNAGKEVYRGKYK
ncbi:unnamed protein product [Cladocopium goreaui]|uniref:Uncharacterized protein n=1 Tax=Cladocopium goreaui TaxID=2562237 RepID=A0A9P1CQU8_9DINO|nr:unnamed protein product [Cladocopium goreaui]